MRYYDKETYRQRLEGLVQNAGKEGGLISIEVANGVHCYSICHYLKAGESKRFHFNYHGDKFDDIDINLNFSANRPPSYNAESKYCDFETTSAWKWGCEWHIISAEEFEAAGNKNEFIVDDSDEERFEIKDGNLTLLERRFQKPARYRSLQGGHTLRWAPVLHVGACGDSIQGFHCISGGTGRSTATWRMTIPEAGRYEVLAKVYRSIIVPGYADPQVTNYYTVYYGDEQEEVEIFLDDVLKDGNYTGWASFGTFDFPEGEVRVVLSDKDMCQRKDIAIVADAIKFIKLDENFSQD